MNSQSIHPIIYVRGYAMTQSEIEDTVADPYMGFNLGSSKIRQVWDGKVKKYFFESPIVRLLKQFAYQDVFTEGFDRVADLTDLMAIGEVPAPLPYRSIIIYRYYEPSSEDLGDGEKPDMRRFAMGLNQLILDLRTRMYPDGDNTKMTPEEIKAGKLPYEKFRVYLVAHSMGGLVCRAFLQNPEFGSGEVRRLVDKVFTYATPHNGIEMSVIGNVPSWLGLYGLNTFNRTEIAKLLALSDGARDGDNVDIVTNFPVDRIFNLVGTDPTDYKVAAGISSLAAGEASDGLVRIKNATTRAKSKENIIESPNAFVHRSHSGYYGIVNSEEGYQNLIRFLFGDVRATGYLEIDKLTFPSAVQEQFDQGKTVKASYLFEVAVSIRGKPWQLHRRLASENSAVFMKFDDLFDTIKPISSTSPGTTPDVKASYTFVAKHEKVPTLFTVFLDMDNSQNKKTLAFAVDLCVRVPDYEVNGSLFFKNHFEGGYLFRDMIILEATPPVDNVSEWQITYQFANEKTDFKLAEIVSDQDSLTFEIPIVQPKAPGIWARLRIETRFWNNW